MDGVIVLDKPQGFTSFDAVAVMRGLAKERKIGHTGTLDPMATGVLPLLLGRAAKACDLLPETGKTYEARFRLGERRDTGDTTGQLVAEDSTPVTREALEAVLPRFRGEIMQTPPMYSAVSVNGKRLYQLARKGIEVERPARPVTIHSLELLDYDPAARQGGLRVRCSKGTYIRVLIEDIAEAAGTLGTMSALRRTEACGFTLADAHTLDSLKALAAEGALASVLRPIDGLFASCPEAAVSAAQASRFRNGGWLDLARLRPAPAGEGLCRVYGPGREFLGVGQLNPQAGRLDFKKLFKLD